MQDDATDPLAGGRGTILEHFLLPIIPAPIPLKKITVALQRLVASTKKKYSHDDLIKCIIERI